MPFNDQGEFVEEFKVGDLAELKTGNGPNLIILSEPDNDGEVTFAYFDHDGVYHRDEDYIPVRALKKIKSE